MIFIELPVFTRVAAGLFDDEALRRIQEILLADPEAGDVIPGGSGLRKLRAPLSGSRKARRGASDLLLVGAAAALLPRLRLCQERTIEP